jgi:anti-anti-sigma factor
MASTETRTFRTEEVALGSTALVSLHGELDIQHRDRAAAALDRALARKPAAVAADLRGLTFMDSMGVHVLINAEARCRRQGVPFFIVRGTPAVDRVLSVLGLDSLFVIVAAPEQLPGGASQLAAAV